jgi:pimeloyl-ACP methyl ester carboxylesterase
LIQDYEVVGDLTLEAVRRIHTRTLLIYGDQSHFLSSYEILHKELPNCEPILLPGGEHFGPLEQPELLTQHMLEFLAEETAMTNLGRQEDLPFGACAG